MNNSLCKVEEKFNILSEYEYISFDLYDTLIFRGFSNVKFLYDYVEYIAKNEYNLIVKNFSKRRIKAESKARSFFKREVNLNDIYSFIKINNSNKELLMSLERKVEIECAVANSQMILLLNRLHECGKKIIVTTDIYLDTETIEKILDINNIFYDHLFISSEIGLTKSSGKLFNYVLNYIKCDSDMICHIGDNSFSDKLMAKSANISSFYQNNCPVYSDCTNYYDDYLYCSKYYFKNYDSILNNDLYEIGYGVLGPFLYDFCCWVKRKSTEICADSILFLAREGYLIKGCYDVMYGDYNSHYIMLNKNLLRFPTLFIDNSLDSFLSTLPSRDGYKVYEICKYFNTTYSILEKIEKFSKFGFNSDDYINVKDPIFMDFYNELLVFFEPEIEKQYKLFVKYMSKYFANKTILLVNNSLEGNGQNMLNKIISKLKIETTIYGCQFVVTPSCKKRLGDYCFGYFNEYSNNYFLHSFKRYTLIFEHLLFENIGTSLCFSEEGVVFDTPYKEQKNYRIIEALQKHCISYISNNKMRMRNESLSIQRLFILFTNPSIEAVSLISELYDDDYEESYKLVNSKNIFGYCRLRNLKIFINSIKERNIIWRQGYLVLENVNPKFLKLYNYIERQKDKKSLKKSRKSEKK